MDLSLIGDPYQDLVDRSGSSSSASTPMGESAASGVHFFNMESERVELFWLEKRVGEAQQRWSKVSSKQRWRVLLATLLGLFLCLSFLNLLFHHPITVSKEDVVETEALAGVVFAIAGNMEDEKESVNADEAMHEEVAMTTKTTTTTKEEASSSVSTTETASSMNTEESTHDAVYEEFKAYLERFDLGSWKEKYNPEDFGFSFYAAHSLLWKNSTLYKETRFAGFSDAFLATLLNTHSYEDGPDCSAGLPKTTKRPRRRKYYDDYEAEEAEKEEQKKKRLPKNFDIRWKMDEAQADLITALDTGDCAGGYAMAAALLTTANAKSPSLLAAQLLLCDHHNHGCRGGSPFEALSTAYEEGLPTAAAMPYEASTQNCCRRVPLPPPPGERVKAPRNACRVNFRKIMEFISNQGGVIADMVVYSDFFFWAGKQPYPYHSCVQKDKKGLGFQPVLVIGFSHDLSGNYLMRAVNSWGVEWGEQGEFSVPFSTDAYNNACLSNPVAMFIRD